MNKDNSLNFETLKRIRDGVHVEVRDNDIEGAVKLLHRRIRECGLLRELKIRRDNPRAQDRAKVKARRAAAHRSRYWKRRAEAARRDTS
jgi:ribosomal protein S21